MCAVGITLRFTRTLRQKRRKSGDLHVRGCGQRHPSARLLSFGFAFPPEIFHVVIIAAARSSSVPAHKLHILFPFRAKKPNQSFNPDAQKRVPQLLLNTFNL